MNGVLREFGKMLRRLHREESGVALMFTLSVILVLYVLCSGVYAVGETIREKIELQTACDSAAYSAALAQADGLSRMAMINRALSWAYVQLSNMEMDYITYKWLELVVKRFKEDRNRCQKWANGSHSACWSNCGSCDSFFKAAKKGWFCGVYRLLGAESNCVSLNDGSPVDIDTLDQFLIVTKSLVKEYPESIRKTKDMINALNAMLPVVNMKMQDSIARTAQAVLYANLPRRTVATSNGDVEVDSELAKDYVWRIWASAPADPYDSNGNNTYFSTLRNTEKDERMFLSFSDGAVHSELLPYFKTDDSQGKPGGLDQWYVRTYPYETKTNSPKFRVDAKNLIGNGICRCYKNANRLGTNMPDSFKMRAHHTGILSDMPPSCMNTHGYNADQCLQIADSKALYAEYEWRAMKHQCVCWTTWHVTWSGVYPVYHHAAFNQILGKCAHYCCGKSSKDHARSEYNSCYIDKLNYYLYHVPAALAIGDCRITKNILSYAPPYGFARIYGDDREICNDSTYDYYTGEVAKPWVLNPNFYNGAGSIIVGMARKQRNSWSRLLRNAADALGMDGVMSAFNPTSYHDGDASDVGNTSNEMLPDNYITVFSASRAAHRYHPSPTAWNKIQDAHPGWDSSHPRYYETRYDSVCDNVVVREQADFVGTGVGCVCDDKNTAAKDNSKRYARCWNLCETDWDATLLPVRFAWTGVSKYYDSFKHTSQVSYLNEVDKTPSQYNQKDVFKSSAHVTMSVAANGIAYDGWLPFYDDSGEALMNKTDVDLSEYVIKDVKGQFLRMPAPHVVITSQSADHSDRSGMLWFYDTKLRSSEMRQYGEWLNEKLETIRQRIL